MEKKEIIARMKEIEDQMDSVIHSKLYSEEQAGILLLKAEMELSTLRIKLLKLSKGG